MRSNYRSDKENAGYCVGSIHVSIAGIWRGRCLPTKWYYTGSIARTCPSSLYTYVTDGGSGFERWQAVNFAGRGKADLNAACSTDAYVTGSGPNLYIDVWKAHRDGVWTSSVTIDYYIAADGAIASCAWEIYLANIFVPEETRTTSLASVALLSCPLVFKYTITLTDIGGITVT